MVDDEDYDLENGCVNLVASSLIANFTEFLASKFNNFNNGIVDLKKFYCFLLLRHLDGSYTLMRSLLIGEEDDARLKERKDKLKKNETLVNIFMPQGPHDLIYKTLVLFRALMKISLTELDGFHRVLSAKVLGTGIEKFNNIHFSFSLYDVRNLWNVFDDHQQKINNVEWILKHCTTLVYTKSKPEKVSISQIRSLYTYINDMNNKKV